jgi:hypothetical protein
LLTRKGQQIGRYDGGPYITFERTQTLPGAAGHFFKPSKEMMETIMVAKTQVRDGLIVAQYMYALRKKRVPGNQPIRQQADD